MPTSSNNTAGDADGGTHSPALSATEQGRLNAKEQGDGVVRSAGIVTIGVFISRIAGLVRESVMARLFGAGQEYDAFNLAFRIPNLTRDLFAEGALASAFIPTFTEYLEERSKQDAARLANLVATTLILVVGTICALGIIYAQEIVTWLAPGYAEVPGKVELATRMTRIMAPFLLLVALAAQVMGILNAHNRFGIPALSSTFFNFGALVAGVLTGYWIGPNVGLAPIEGMAVGVIFGGILQLGFQLPTLYRLGFKYWPVFDWNDSGLRRILRLMVPALIGNAAVQVNVVVNTNFASNISDPIRGFDGPVSWLAYSFRLIHLPLGLFGVAVGSAMLPSISRSAAAGKLDDFRHTLSHSLGTVFLLTLPSAVGLAILAQSIIGAIYQGGAFEIYDTQQAGLAVTYYSAGLIGYAGMRVLVPAFYTLGDSRSPMVLSFISIAVNYTVASTLIRIGGMGHAALALTSSVVAIFQFLVLFLMLRNRLDGIHGRALVTQFLKITAASAAMAVVIYGSSAGVENWLGLSKTARVADVLLSVPLGLTVFYVSCRILGLSEIDAVAQSFTNPLRRGLRRLFSGTR